MTTGIHWSATLTGAPDSLSDLTLSLSGLSADLRDSTASFLSFLVDFDQLEDVLDRPNGEIILYRTELPDGSPVEVKRVSYSETRYWRGATRRSLHISGRTTAAWTAPGYVTLQAVTRDGTYSDGRRYLEAGVTDDVRPGDVVTYNATSAVVESVSIRASERTASQVIVEGSPGNVSVLAAVDALVLTEYTATIAP